MINEKIKLKDLCFYGIDASKERYATGEKYLDLFLELSQFKIQDFVDGRRFIIRGNKGAGKSAILNYIYQNNKENTKLFYFDEMTDNNSMGDYSRLQHIEYDTYYQKESKPISKAWELFIIKTIIYECHQNNSLDIFIKDSNFEELYKLLYSMYDVLDDYIIPTCKKRNFIWRSVCENYIKTFGSNNKQISNKKYIDEILMRFYKLVINKNSFSKFYILFDELNFTDRNENEKMKQKNMIADLVLTIDRLYKKFHSIGLNVVIISSIRNEVQQVIGLELNKTLIDYGIDIDWNNFSDDETRNPIISLMLKRIKNSYKDKESITEEDILSTWFSTAFISKSTLYKNIINHTWGKPRDLIIIFIQLMDKYPNYEQITKSMLNNAYKLLAREAWKEIAESMKASCSLKMIDEIEKIIPVLPQKFNFTEFTEIFKEVFDLKEFTKNDAYDYVEILYRYGIIGVENTSENSKRKTPYFYYRGHISVLNFSSIFVLHPTMEAGKELI